MYNIHCTWWIYIWYMNGTTTPHWYNSIAVFCFCVLTAILLLGASHNPTSCASHNSAWFWTKGRCSQCCEHDPRTSVAENCKTCFSSLQQSPSLSSPFFLAIVFPLFPLVCSSSPHAARSQDFCLCKSAKTHTGWGKVQNQPSIHLISTLSSFCPFTKNPLFIIIIIMIVYSDGNLGGNLLL